jgi:hypothetical protein
VNLAVEQCGAIHEKGSAPFVIRCRSR